MLEFKSINRSVRAEKRMPRCVGEADNQALIDGVQNGNRAAAFAFCDKYGPRINRWVWRLLGADRDHDEMVQQIYVGVFSSLSKLKDLSALDAYVDSVAIRTVRKEIRRRCYKRQLFGALKEASVEEIRDESSPFKQAHIRAFYALLDALNADERVVFVLKHFEGMTLEEIARVGGYSLRTAKRRLQKGTARLRDRVMTETVLVSLLEEF